ncbi:uncharacterized protein LOC106673706 [Cimex lectularius]|uniref:Uncharacterized protein n=1 Tax=Cimex lectularius TaxID=79782 RepID=A0A8I6TMW9_CIMLE|nr:uncharacterized protein LOC106673706 [Cimex lectularius]
MAKLYVHLVKRSEEDFILAGLSEDKKLWCTLPDDQQDLLQHKVLCSKSTVKSAIASIKPIKGYRKIGLKLDDDLKREYFDKDDNLCFKNSPLEESLVVSDTSWSEREIILAKKIEELEIKLIQRDENKLQDVEKKFILQKFDKTQNPTEWFSRFESECARNKINNMPQVIEALRFFLTGSANRWYDSSLKKIGLTDLHTWRNSFLTVFGDKGWIEVRKAYNFKYLGGSLIDYAVTKENLCLEIESNSTLVSRINMIVIGLPIEVQNELDREEINSIEKLYTALRKFDNQYQRVREYTSNDRTEKVNTGLPPKKKQTEVQTKSPCYMCETLGWKNRFHPTYECRNKTLYTQRKESNFMETKQNLDSMAKMMKTKFDGNTLN